MEIQCFEMRLKHAICSTILPTCAISRDRHLHVCPVALRNFYIFCACCLHSGAPRSLWNKSVRVIGPDILATTTASYMTHATTTNKVTKQSRNCVGKLITHFADKFCSVSENSRRNLAALEVSAKEPELFGASRTLLTLSEALREVDTVRKVTVCDIKIAYITFSEKLAYYIPKL